MYMRCVRSAAGLACQALCYNAAGFRCASAWGAVTSSMVCCTAACHCIARHGISGDSTAWAQDEMRIMHTSIMHACEHAVIG
jgi:hypothetical protein